MVLTITLTISLALPAFAMDLGFAAPAFDASAYARATTQQVELTVNLAEMETAAAQPPIVSEGGNLNGGSGDINTIIVQGGTPTVGPGGTVERYEILALTRDNDIISVNAGTIITNFGTVEVNFSTGEITGNNGTVKTNKQGGIVYGNTGTVINNYGKIIENNGTVTYNYSGGTVQTNLGAITHNAGTVTTNEQSGAIESLMRGTVETNRGTINALVGGTVETNNGLINQIAKNGIVQTNQKDGIIITNEGTVTKNYGTVDNYPGGIVETNYADGIVFNYGGTITDNQGVELFRVTISRSANTSVTDAANGLVAHNGEAWKEAGNISSETATVTISPAAGYTITKIAAAEGITPVQNADGSWTVAVDASLVNEGKFSLDTSVSKTPPYNGGDDPDPYYHGGREQYFADILSLLDITLEPAATATAYNAGPNAFDSFNAETLAAVKDAPADSIVEIDLRKTGWTTLKRDVFEAAAARGDVTIIIYYSQWGRDYTLTIPAGTDLSAVISGAQYLDASRLPALLNLKAE